MHMKSKGALHPDNKRGGILMKKSVFRFFAFAVFAMLCTMLLPQAAEAKPHILYHVEHVYLNDPGEATIVGYFQNDGDRKAYVKWTEFDLTLTADNGQQMWADTGIRHDLDLEVPAGESVEYTFFIQNPDIPEYHGRFRWRTRNCRTHWDVNAG